MALVTGGRELVRRGDEGSDSSGSAVEVQSSPGSVRGRRKKDPHEGSAVIQNIIVPLASSYFAHPPFSIPSIHSWTYRRRSRVLEQKRPGFRLSWPTRPHPRPIVHLPRPQGCPLTRRMSRCAGS